MQAHRPRVRAPLLAIGALLWSTGCNSCSCSMGYELGVSSSTSASGPPPLPDGPPTRVGVSRDEALEVYRHYVSACTRGDAKELWETLVDRHHQAAEARAADLRELGPKDLREALGYRGPIEDFSGFELLQIDAFGEFGECSRVGEWKVGQFRPESRGYVAIVQHPRDWAMAFRVTRDANGVLRVELTQWRNWAP